MAPSSSRKRSTPSASQSSRKRHQANTVYFPSSIEQGPSGTGQTDTRNRSPERSSFKRGSEQQRYAIFPKSPDNLDEDDQDAYGACLDAYNDNRTLRGFTKNSALTALKSQWTDYVIDKYGDVSVMTEQGFAPLLEHGRGACPPGEPLSDGESDVMIEKPASKKPFNPEDYPVHESKTQKLFEENKSDRKDKDEVVCYNMFKLIGSITKFAEEFGRKLKVTVPAAEFMDGLLVQRNAQLVRYIGCLAIGGKNGEEGWQELLTSPDKREALVVGILGRALKEHVFSDLCFGCRDGEKTELKKQEVTWAEKGSSDGFSRTVDRARKIRTYIKNTDQTALGKAVAMMTMKLEKMLGPFYDGVSSELPAKVRDMLKAIVKDAADLSRLMRLAPDVIYYWSSTFKDEEFEPGRMECFNIEHMIQNSPYEKKTINNVPRAVPRKGANPDETEAIVKIVCFPGLVAYRQGGGALADAEIQKENDAPDNAPPDVQQAKRQRLARPGQGEPTRDDGFRSRTICKSIVYLIWGKQRLLTREAGTSAHIDAMREGKQKKYDDDYEGFKELFEIAEDKWAAEEKAAALRASPSKRRWF